MGEARYNVECMLWCKTESSDKIWGFITLPSNLEMRYSFWGRRGKALTWKRYEGVPGRRELMSLRVRKTGRENYHAVSLPHIEAATPGFTDAFELSFVGARLCHTYHGE